MALVGESLDMIARVYHTENGNVHLEGETYAVTDRALGETLYGIGFASPVGWTADPPDPPIGRRGPDAPGHRGDHHDKPGPGHDDPPGRRR